MKTALLFIIFFFNSVVHAQTNAIIGRVIDAEDKEVLENCNVFISKSRIGTVTDEKGEFVLNSIQANSAFQLVVSKAGYETFAYDFSSEQLPLNVKISLNKKVLSIDNADTIPNVVNGWQKWGNLFMNYLLGASENGLKCQIENAGIIKFKENTRENLLEVSVDEVLIIRNYSLGYLIKYQLEKFVYDFNKQRVSYLGYPLFLEMEPNQPLSPDYRWKRTIAYKGSLMHLIRSLYADKLKEEGFEVKRMQRMPGKDTIRDDGKSMHHFFTIDPRGHRKKLPYIIKNYKEITDSGILTNDSILVKAVDGKKDILSFNNYLYIRYLSEKEPIAYRNSFPFEPSRNFQLSKLSILNKEKKIQAGANGFFYPGTDLLVEGYMDWEKIGDMLPIDYSPSMDN